MGPRIARSRKDMPGTKVGESQGKVTGRRALPGDGRYLKMEISFEEQGTLLSVGMWNMGTFEVYERISGQLFGSGQGMLMTQDGGGSIWSGSGVGTVDETGTMAFVAGLTVQTDAENLKRLNHALLVVEHTSSMEGAVRSTIHA